MAAASLSMRMTLFGIQKAFPSVRTVTCEQVGEWRSASSKNLVCLDVRPEEEYRVSHVAGAVRVEPSSQPDLQGLGITPGSTVVCYCSVGYRSSDMAQRVARVARDTNLPLEVYNLQGGIFQWAMEGRHIVDKEGERTSVVHPYSAVWGKLLPGRLRATL